MTLQNLARLMLHYYKIVLAIIVAFVLAGGLFVLFVVPSRYEATATVTVSDPSGSVTTSNLVAIASSFAHAEAAKLNEEQPALDVSVQSGLSSAPQVVSITVESTAEGECIELANAVAAKVSENADSLFAELQETNDASLADLSALSNADEVAAVLSGSVIQETLGTDRTFEFCSFLVNDAIKAEPAGIALPLLVLAAIAFGVLGAAVVVISIDHARCPLRTRQDIEGIANVPIIADSSEADWGERAWVNLIALSRGASVDSVCVFPVGEGESDLCIQELETSAKALVDLPLQIQCDGLASISPVLAVRLCGCSPLKESALDVLRAREAAATVVCARLWADSRRDLEDTLSQLRIAEVPIAGLIVLRG